MTIKDRRNKSYEWTAHFDCPNPNCGNGWGVQMEFNNGKDFLIDKRFNRFCPKCGTEGDQISEDEALSREQIWRAEARKERDL